MGRSVRRGREGCGGKTSSHWLDMGKTELKGKHRWMKERKGRSEKEAGK